MSNFVNCCQIISRSAQKFGSAQLSKTLEKEVGRVGGKWKEIVSGFVNFDLLKINYWFANFRSIFFFFFNLEPVIGGKKGGEDYPKDFTDNP